MKYYTFPCGCKFEVTDDTVVPVRVKFEPKIDAIPLTCPRTWDLIGEGNTRGVFQLESHLGQSWAKRLKPENIEQLSALTAIIRPGCAQAKIDGKSITQHYVDRKNGKEPVDCFHPSLESTLSPTYGLLIYQEQAMHIAQKIAGFDLQQADVLRKAIGKKKPELMAQMKTEFLEGSKKQNVVNKEEAEEIFGWIEKSQRYSFNACLDPDTLVETVDGEFISLQDVHIGDIIASPDGPTKIVNKYDNGIKDLYEITLESGKTIKCTLDHQFLCSDQKKYPLWEILYKNLKIRTQDE